VKRLVFTTLGVSGAVLAVATGGLAATGTGVTATPKSGTQHTTFTVRFTAPHSSGRHGLRFYKYFVAARGSKVRGCRALTSTVPMVHAGERVSVRLATRRRWCSGDFHGRVYQIEANYCRKQTSCPLVVRVRILGSFSFRVRK
jgi:hypothetical protein